MDTRSGPFRVELLLVTLVALNVAFEPLIVDVLLNGAKVLVGVTDAFTGSFFVWATHPVARIHPIVMRRVRSTIIFIGVPPFFLMDSCALKRLSH
jgi:hypothetical protein